MSKQDEDFSIEQVDQQVGQHSLLASSESKRLILDLQQGYQNQLDQNERSLERVWHRLEQHATNNKQMPIISMDQYQKNMHKRNSSMKMSIRSSSWGRTQKTLSLLVAMIVVALLIGSTMFIFNRSKYASTKPVVHGSSASTPAPFQDRPDSAGIFVTSSLDAEQFQISKLNPTTHRPLWSVPVGASPQYTIHNNTLYVASSGTANNFSKYLYAIDANSGNLLWRHTFAPDITKTAITANIPGQGNKTITNTNDLGYLTAPVESNGIVYTLARSGKLYALHADSGKLAWQSKINASALVTDPNDSGTIYDAAQLSVVNNVVYGAMHNLLFALKDSNGTPLWSTQITSEDVFNQVNIVGSMLYVSASHVSTHTTAGFTNPSSVFAFNLHNGQQQWHHDFPTWLVSSPTISNGVIYVGTYDGNVSALNASTGSVQWTQNIGGRADLTPPIVVNGIIYTEEDGSSTPMSDNTIAPAIVALNSHGQQIWSIPATSLAAPIDLQTVANGIVYVSQFPNQVTAYNAKSGQQVWQQIYSTVPQGSAPTVVVIP